MRLPRPLTFDGSFEATPEQVIPPTTLPVLKLSLTHSQTIKTLEEKILLVADVFGDDMAVDAVSPVYKEHRRLLSVIVSRHSQLSRNGSSTSLAVTLACFLAAQRNVKEMSVNEAVVKSNSNLLPTLLRLSPPAFCRALQEQIVLSFPRNQLRGRSRLESEQALRLLSGLVKNHSFYSKAAFVDMHHVLMEFFQSFYFERPPRRSDGNTPAMEALLVRVARIYGHGTRGIEFGDLHTVMKTALPWIETAAPFRYWAWLVGVQGDVAQSEHLWLKPLSLRVQILAALWRNVMSAVPLALKALSCAEDSASLWAACYKCALVVDVDDKIGRTSEPQQNGGEAAAVVLPWTFERLIALHEAFIGCGQSSLSNGVTAELALAQIVRAFGAVASGLLRSRNAASESTAAIIRVAGLLKTSLHPHAMALLGYFSSISCKTEREECVRILTLSLEVPQASTDVTTQRSEKHFQWKCGCGKLVAGSLLSCSYCQDSSVKTWTCNICLRRQGTSTACRECGAAHPVANQLAAAGLASCPSCGVVTTEPPSGQIWIICDSCRPASPVEMQKLQCQNCHAALKDAEMTCPQCATLRPDVAGSMWMCPSGHLNFECDVVCASCTAEGNRNVFIHSDSQRFMYSCWECGCGRSNSIRSPECAKCAVSGLGWTCPCNTGVKGDFASNLHVEGLKVKSCPSCGMESPRDQQLLLQLDKPCVTCGTLNSILDIDCPSCGDVRCAHSPYVQWKCSGCDHIGRGFACERCHELHAELSEFSARGERVFLWGCQECNAWTPSWKRTCCEGHSRPSQGELRARYFPWTCPNCAHENGPEQVLMCADCDSFKNPPLCALCGDAHCAVQCPREGTAPLQGQRLGNRFVI